MNSKINLQKEKEHSQKDFDELYKYLKSILNINKTLSNAFLGITLTAFIFLLSLGYPDILDLALIIGGISIKVVSLSLSILVLSFFFFLTSTFLLHYSELRLYRFYLHWDSELTLSNRYEKCEKIHNVYYKVASLILIYGVIFLIIAVFFIFFTFSMGGIIMVIITSLFIVFVINLIFLYLNMKEIITKKKKNQKSNP